MRRIKAASTGITRHGFAIDAVFFLIKIKPMITNIARNSTIPVTIILLDMIKLFSLYLKFS
ncbi:hypothetical protein ES708_26601 [subsurface metagenome]